MLPAVAIVTEPVLLVCFNRIVPAAVVEAVVSVSSVSSASETVIHTVISPAPKPVHAEPAPLYKSPEDHGTG